MCNILTAIIHADDRLQRRLSCSSKASVWMVTHDNCSQFFSSQDAFGSRRSWSEHRGRFPMTTPIQSQTIQLSIPSEIVRRRWQTNRVKWKCLTGGSNDPAHPTCCSDLIIKSLFAFIGKWPSLDLLPFSLTSRLPMVTYHAICDSFMHEDSKPILPLHDCMRVGE